MKIFLSLIFLIALNKKLKINYEVERCFVAKYLNSAGIEMNYSETKISIQIKRFKLYLRLFVLYQFMFVLLISCQFYMVFIVLWCHMKSGNTNFTALFILEDCKFFLYFRFHKFSRYFNLFLQNLSINLAELFGVTDTISLFLDNVSISE